MMPFIPLETESQPTEAQPKQGFTPLADNQPARGFTPLEAPEQEHPSLAKTIALENPATAIGETVLNFGTQMVALPVAGLFGLYEAGGKALGLHDRDPAGVVEHMAHAMTYQPRGEMGQMATEAVGYPFKKLAEAGQAAGDKVLESTGSSVAATSVDTAINMIPMAISPAWKGSKAVRTKVAERIFGREEAPEAVTHETTQTMSDWSRPEPIHPQETAPMAPREGVINDRSPIEAAPSGVDRLAKHEGQMHEPQSPGMEKLWSQGDNGLPGVDGEFRSLPEGRGVQAERGSLAGEEGHRPGLYPGERSMGLAEGAEPTVQRGQRGRSAAEGFTQVAEVGADDPRATLTSPAGADAPGRLILPDTGPLSRAANLAISQEPARKLFPFGSLEAAESHLAGRPGYQVAPHPTAPGKYAIMPVDQAQGVGGKSAGGVHAMVADAKPRLGFTPLESSPAAGGGEAVRSQFGEPKASNEFTPVDQNVPAGEVRNSWAPGANYAPLIDDARGAAGAASVVDLPAPIRRETIIRDLEKALDTTVYEGKVKGKRLGFFRPKLEEVRIKNANDLEVAAHELAHLVDDRIPEISKAWRFDKALREELLSVSYDKKSVAEGYAEAVRLWMTQPDVLQARAPKVAAWLDDFAAKHPYGQALRTAQEQMTGWFGQDALNRARSKIGSEKPLAEYFDRAWDKFRQSTADDLHGIYQMERSLNGGKLAPVGAYETARLSRASASIADGAIRYGHPVKLPDGSFKYQGRGLEEILKPLAGNLEDALLYFVGRSAHELKMQGRENLFSKGEIDAMLRLKTPERAEAFKAYQEWNKGILDFAEAHGVINPETRKLWKRVEYLPFHRVASPESGLKGKPGDWRGVQALTGGTENIRDVLGNMVANAAMLIDRAVKNEARVKVAELAARPGGGRFMARIDPGSRPVRIGGDQVLGELMKRYGIAIEGDAPAFFEFFVHGQPPGGGNVVAVLKGGKPAWYEVGDPILYRSLSSIDRPPTDWLVKWIGLPKRIGQATITLTPDFMLGNIARDTLMGAVMSRAGFRPVIDSLQGMRLRMTQDPLYRDYIANGGGLSSIYLDEAKLRTKLEKFYSSQGIDYRTVLDTPDKILSFIETVGDAFETSTRLGEYRRAIQAGEHPRHAAYLGREVSTDFAMRGDSKALGFMYDTVVFLRPAVVSMDRLFRGVAHDQNRAAIGMKTAMIGLSSVALYLLNRDDPRYADLADWDRDANWHFFVGDQHFRYPKIWEIGAVASTAERTTEKLMEQDPQGLGKDLARIVSQTFSLNLMPQLLAPLYEQATNRNNFTKAPIETQGMENVQPFLRAKPNTSETMKAIGMATRNMPEALQVNPARAEALMRGYLNTWGMYGLMLSDRAFFGDQLPEVRRDQLPVVRRFYAQEPAQHTKFETQFYDMLGEAKRLHGTLRELDKLGRADIADQKEQSPLASEVKPLERAAKNVKDINAEMLQVHRDKTLTPAEKRQRLDDLTAERNALMKAAVLDSQAAQRVGR